SLTLVSCSLSGKVEIPETVTKNGTQYKVTVIGKDAFIANKITSLYIPSSLDVIYNFAFKGCSKLTSVTFADSVGWVRKTMNNTIEEKVTLVDASDAATLLKEYYQYRQGIAVIVEHQYVWTKTSV
ncbi:MAG: leucine-rich repeat protein, partial [Clostridia bacterium]|nr:leucine-rich repeat protein [Clostridia bacterium]